MWRHGFSLAACLFLAACNPYTRFVGENSAGAVDPVNFPAAYLAGLHQRVPQCVGRRSRKRPPLRVWDWKSVLARVLYRRPAPACRNAL